MKEIKNDKFLKMNGKKEIAKSNANYLMEMSCKKEYLFKKYTLQNRANNILKCLDYWQWDKYEKSKVLDLKMVYRCKDLFCPNCRTVKNIKAIYRFTPYFKLMLDNGYIPFLMTLTNPNCKGSNLSQEIDKMNKAYRTLWLWINAPIGKNKQGFKDRIFNAVGCIKNLEMTISNDRQFHVHFHCIIFLDKFSKDDFIKNISGGFRKKSNNFIKISNADLFIKKLWTVAYKGKNISLFDKIGNNWFDSFICDIEELEIPKGIYEAFKYPVKDSDIESYEIFKDIYEGLFNKRLYQGYGKLYRLSKDIEAENNILENIDDLIIDNEEAEELFITSINEITEKYKDFKCRFIYKKIMDCRI